MRIGIMGGTFDPIHNGHLMLGEYAYQNFQLDQVWFMPNGNPPHKLAESIQSDVAKRMAMVSLAIAEYSYFKISSCEANADDVSYSYRTMERLSLFYPDDEFYFIMGADSLGTIERWQHPNRLFKACTVLAACRDDVDSEALMVQINRLNAKYQADIRLLVAPLDKVSSRQIRDLVKAMQPIEEFVPQTVKEYIKEHKLFLH